MLNRPTYQLLIGCFACLFVALQGTALAHATQYGDVSHEHNGMVCAVDAITSTDEVIKPAPVLFGTSLVQHSVSYYTSYRSIDYTTPHGRAPPPRSPPYLP